MLGVSKQAYHKQKGDVAARKAAMESFALEYIHKIRSVDPGIGGMKLWYMYKRDFPDRERVGRDRFEDIIHRYGLKVRNKMRKPRTTDSTHGLPLFPNLTYNISRTLPISYGSVISPISPYGLAKVNMHSVICH